MKHVKLILTALVLSVILLFILIVGPDTEEKILEGHINSSIEKVSADVSEGEELIEQKQELLSYGFDLKYDRYLVKEPYIYVRNGEERCFQFDVMRQKIAVVEEAIEKYRLTYIDNYKNRNGDAPYYKGSNVDSQGNRRSAAVPAYANIDDREEFIYLADGTLVEVLEEDEDFTLVLVVATGMEYSVPSKYVPTDDCLTELKKAIIVDRTNQNIATFEKRDKNWNVTSYSMATTGKEGKYHELTPLGFYYAIEKKPKFFYVKDGTDKIDGYAPYAVRFSAGAYIHGVSTTYKYAEGKRIDTGINEFSSSIGTVPLSHKCVRNYTSHAKFIYDWYEHGKTIVIVIE